MPVNSVSGPASTCVSDFGARWAETVPTLCNTPSPAAKLAVDRASSHEVARTIQEHEGRRGMLPLYTTRVGDRKFLGASASSETGRWLRRRGRERGEDAGGRLDDPAPRPFRCADGR